MRKGLAVKDVLLVGAGHAHVEVLRRFGLRPPPSIRLTLLTREVDAPYSGMLPGLVAGHYAFAEAHVDAGRLARFAGARLCRDEATGIDLLARVVLCRGGSPVPFDVLSLDIGSRPNTATVPGADAHAIPVKPIDGFLARFAAVRARVQAGRSRHVLLVGGGAGGTELLLSVERRLRRDAPDPASLRFTLVAGSGDILPGFPAAFRARFRAVLASRGIAVRTGRRVTAVEPGAVLLNNERVLADEVLWTTQAAPAPWLAGTGLPLEGGFLSVDATLRAAPGVFAAGDTIAFRPGAIPRSGVQAVRAGPVLAGNLRATLAGGRLRPYRPQADALAILSTGGRYAVLTRNGVTLEGRWAWRLKDWIDRRWIARYNGLAPASAPGPAEHEPWTIPPPNPRDGS